MSSFHQTGMRFVISLVAALALTGCSSLSTEPDKVDWVFGDKEVFFDIITDNNLNLHNDQPHSVVVGVYQLSKPNTFNDLSSTSNGLRTLLMKGKVDDTVLSFDRIIVYQDARKPVTLSRMESAEYIGIVAGYFNLGDPASVAKLYSIPIDINSEGLLFKKSEAKPGIFWLRLFLGSDKIVSAKLLTKAETDKNLKKDREKRREELRKKANNDEGDL